MMSAAVRSVVLGAWSRGLSGAALDFDFVNGRGFNSIDRAKLTPDSILTYTAPSPKWVYNAAGLLVQSSGQLPYDYDPVTHAALGVLIEEQRTNLLTYSEQFDNAAWIKGNSTVTANAAVAPNGTTTADKLIPQAASSDGRTSQAFTGAIGATYTLTLYGKQAEFSNCRLYSDDGGTNSVSVSYNLATGAVSTAVAVVGGNWTGASSKIKDVGNGWYCMSLTWTATAVAPSRISYWCRNTGDGTSGIFIWGAQLEAGAFPTSYIPTVASQVTRAADQVSILTSAFAYNAAAGTCAVETYNTYSFNFPEPWYLGDSAAITTKRIQTFLSGTSLTGRINDTTEQASVNAGSITLGAFNKFSMAWAVNDIGISLNAGAVATDTVATIPSTINQFGIGGRPSSGQINGHIKRLTYFPVRKTNAELQVLSR